MKIKSIFILTLTVIFLLTVGCSKNDEKLYVKDQEQEITQTVYCSECGKSAKEVTKYCPNCGKETKWTTEKVQLKSDKEEKNEQLSSSSNVENKENTESKKQENGLNCRDEYIKRLDQLEEGMSDLDYLYEGSTMDMKNAESKRYERWDKMLNEIYALLKQYMTTSEIEDLKNKQIEWVNYRDQKAENDGSEFEGGTMEGLVYLGSLAETTKERCYELVNTYMK